MGRPILSPGKKLTGEKTDRYTGVNHLDGEKRAGCFAYFVFLVSLDSCVALPRDTMGLSAVCNCGIS